MGKIYKGIWGCVFKLSQVGDGGDSSIRMEGRSSASLIYRGDGGG